MYYVMSHSIHYMFSKLNNISNIFKMQGGEQKVKVTCNSSWDYCKSLYAEYIF